MRCDELQTKIAVRDALTPDEARHARNCSDCAAYAAFDAGLVESLEGWRDPGILPMRHRPRTSRLAYFGAGLAASLALAALALSTRATAQDAYHRMLARTREVRSVHLVVRWRPGNGKVEDGPMRQTQELWWQAGAWRETWERGRPKIKRLGKGGITFYRYDPATRRVEASREVAPQRDYRYFDLASFAGQYMDAPKRFEQPSPTRIVTTNGGDWSRMVFTLDPTTGLPTHAEKQSRAARGVWQAAGEIDLEFDRPIPDDLFDPQSLREKAKP